MLFFLPGVCKFEIYLSAVSYFQIFQTQLREIII